MTGPSLELSPTLERQLAPSRINWPRLLLAYACLIAAYTAINATDASFHFTASLSLHDLRFPDLFTSIVAYNAAGAIFLFLFPFLSYISDRNRTRYGRRIPYLAVAILPCAILFAITGWTPVIGGAHFPMAFTMTTLAVLFVVYQLFNLMLDNALIWLVGDTIPSHQLARFFALVRIAGSIVGFAAGSAFITSSKPTYSFEHRPLIHGIGAALLLIAFGLVIAFVREKPIDPPRDTLPGASAIRRLLNAFANFFVESFAHPIYLAYYAFGLFTAISWTGSIYHMLHLRDNVHIPLQEIGRVAGITALVTIVLAFPAAWLADWIHPMRALLIGLLLQIPITIAGFFMNSYGTYLAFTLLSLPMLLLKGAASAPLDYRLYPRKQFAQLRFVGRVFASVGTLLGSVCLGFAIDWVQRKTPSRSDAYRYVYLWELCFQLIALACFLITYVYWKKHGAGNFHYEVERQPQHHAAFPVIQTSPAG